MGTVTKYMIRTVQDILLGGQYGSQSIFQTCSNQAEVWRSNMSSRIEQLIDEIEEYIDNCKYKAFSTDVIMVNKAEIDDLLRELRMKTPEEIKRYQKIISNKEAILNDARQKAQALIDDAEVQTTELVSEHQIMQEAYAQADKIVEMATQQAQGILDSATIEANNMKTAAMQYTDSMLANLENILKPRFLVW